jgi:hypothetical protein
MQEAGSQVKGEFPYLLMSGKVDLFRSSANLSKKPLFRSMREQSSHLRRQLHERSSFCRRGRACW